MVSLIGRLILAAATAAVTIYASDWVRYDRNHREEDPPDPYEDVVGRDVVDTDDIDVTFVSIGGYHRIKQELHDLLVLPFQRPELFSSGMLGCPQRGVLLYGPPGTGKTVLAKAIVRESGAAFINVRISNLMSERFGEPRKLVAVLFTLAKKIQPTIIFIDEADGLLSRRRATEHEALTGIKTEFMSQWDGFNTDKHARVIVLAATNRREELDEAFLRRLPQAFEIGVPNCMDRADILRVILRHETVKDGMSLPIGVVTYMQHNNLKMFLRTIDNSTDTSEIAKAYGGGGSASSSSFIIRMDEYNQWLSTQSSPSRKNKTPIWPPHHELDSTSKVINTKKGASTRQIGMQSKKELCGASRWQTWTRLVGGKARLIACLRKHSCYSSTFH